MITKSSPPREREQAGFTIVEVLVVLVFISVVAGIAIQTALFAFDVARLSRSVANMRQVSSAIVQYESMNNGLPPGGLQRVAVIVPILGSQAGKVDTKDGWGHDLWYQPVVVNGTTNFRLFCYGKDGTPDGSITGVWSDFFTDVVMEGGAFIQTKW
jgi:prepilin-type N-terminal cleavage/methylation domain-containing protein